MKASTLDILALRQTLQAKKPGDYTGWQPCIEQTVDGTTKLVLKPINTQANPWVETPGDHPFLRMQALFALPAAEKERISAAFTPVLGPVTLVGMYEANSITLAAGEKSQTLATIGLGGCTATAVHATMRNGDQIIVLAHSPHPNDPKDFNQLSKAIQKINSSDITSINTILLTPQETTLNPVTNKYSQGAPQEALTYLKKINGLIRPQIQTKIYIESYDPGISCNAFAIQANQSKSQYILYAYDSRTGAVPVKSQSLI